MGRLVDDAAGFGQGGEIGHQTLTLARDGAAIVVNGRADKGAVDAVVAEIEGAGGRAMACQWATFPILPCRRVWQPKQRPSSAGSIFWSATPACVARRRSSTCRSTNGARSWRWPSMVRFLLGKAIVPQMVARGGGALRGALRHLYRMSARPIVVTSRRPSRASKA